MSVRALALRIRMARANAHQGELIGPDVAQMFRDFLPDAFATLT
jgi:hypothetical protein